MKPVVNDDNHAEQERLSALGKSIDPSFVDSKRVCGLLRWASSERIKKGHRLSDLVVRKTDKGELILASFIYYYTLNQINQGKIPRPTEWLQINFVNGQPIARLESQKVEFSSAPYDEIHDFDVDEGFDLSPEYYRAAYNLLDEVRIEYMQTGVFNHEKYGKYLDAIKHNTPTTYRRFFDDLSDPDGEHPVL